MVGPDLKIKRGFFGYRSRLERQIDKEILLNCKDGGACFDLPIKMPFMSSLLSRYMKLGWERISANVNDNGTSFVFLEPILKKELKA